jgi:hypothetical protein
MIITKPGILPKDKEGHFKGSCYTCGCEFLFLPSEAIRKVQTGEGFGYYEIKCPTEGCEETPFSAFGP